MFYGRKSQLFSKPASLFWFTRIWVYIKFEHDSLQWCDSHWCDSVWCHVIYFDVKWCDSLWCCVIHFHVMEFTLMWFIFMWWDSLWCDALSNTQIPHFRDKKTKFQLMYIHLVPFSKLMKTKSLYTNNA